jgi:hypothetical protein
MAYAVFSVLVRSMKAIVMGVRKVVNEGLVSRLTADGTDEKRAVLAEEDSPNSNPSLPKR